MKAGVKFYVKCRMNVKWLEKNENNDDNKSEKSKMDSEINHWNCFNMDGKMNRVVHRVLRRLMKAVKISFLA